MSARVAIYAAPGSLSTDAVGARLREEADWWIGRSAIGVPVPEWADAVQKRFGRRGRPDAGAAEGAPQPVPLAADWTRAEVDAITVDARRYGFHATLKAPFRLAEGRTLAELEQAVADFAATRPVVEVPTLALGRLGDFFALVPGAPAEPLYALAAEVVTAFDGFRAPASVEEIARRNPAGMSEHQRELFERWGYPYVLDEFRLHFTVTDRIAVARRDQVEAVLAEWFAPSIGRTIPLDCLALFIECQPGTPFELLSVHPLGLDARPAGATRPASVRAAEGAAGAGRTGAGGRLPMTITQQRGTR